MADQLTDDNQPEQRPAAVPVIALTPVEDKPSPVRTNIVAAVAPAPKPEPATYPLTPIRATATPAPGRSTAPAYRPPPARRMPQAVRPSYRVEGFVCLLVAVGWAIAAQRAYNWVGTLILYDQISRAFTLMPSQPQASTQVGPGGLAPARGMQQSFSLFPPVNPRRPAINPSLNAETDLNHPAPTSPSSVQGESPNLSREADRLRALDFAEGTRLTWTIVMFTFAGIIAVAGISAAFRTTATRLPPFAIICTGLGGCLGALIATPSAHSGSAAISANQPLRAKILAIAQTAAAWIVGITQDKNVWVAFLAVGLLVAAICGLVALRPTSNPRRWIVAAIVVIFLGTAGSLIGISILERQAGFPPLAIWADIVVAAGQSFFAWVLLSMLHLRHPAPAK